MTHASVFSGIGGPEVAAAMLGWQNLFHCEINPFGRKVLDYWFPDSKSYEDITKTDFREWRGRVDVLTGGFPCQPFSCAGKRRGAEDDRYLWPHMHRCINEIQPTWFIGENVAGILTMVEQGHVSEVASEATLFGEEDYIHRYEHRGTFTLERICRDVEADGYEVFPILIPACALGLPTDETECSSSDIDFKLLNTPTSVQTSESPESLRARMDAHGWKNGTKYGSLQAQVLHDPKARQMLGMLPTPTAIEGYKYTNTWNPNSQMGQSLSAMAGSGMLPTPRVSGQEGYESRAKRKGHECAMSYLETAVDYVAHQTQSVPDGESSRLSPLFTEEMMGFPLMWTTLPFLSRNGETSQSKPTETPSSPK